jgi:hypothetical protein
MSYEISYRRQVFRIPAAQCGHYDDILFLVEEAGSNNCWEIGNRRRARSWQCTAAGAEWECLAEVTRIAAACCGGSLVLYGRRRSSPEEYIRAWRRAIAGAGPFVEASSFGFGLRLFTRMTESEAANGRKYAFDCLSQQALVSRTQCERDGIEGWEWRFDAGVPEQVKLWRETRAGGPAWRSVDVWGPRR